MEPNVKLKQEDLASLGDDLEKAPNGFVDFLLLDDQGKPLIVLEAKSESKNPLSAKEQARRYARSQNARFVILSNGNIHYLWDLQQGNPTVVNKFPSPSEIGNHYSFQPDAERLAGEHFGNDYIALTQMPGYAQEASWKVALTAQRYRIRRRIFDTLLKRRIYHRFGASQFSGMILICFLGERLPPRSSGVDLRTDERSPLRGTGFRPACRTTERPRQKQVGQAPSGNRGAARQRVHPEVHREALQFFACQPRKLD